MHPLQCYLSKDFRVSLLSVFSRQWFSTSMIFFGQVVHQRNSVLFLIVEGYVLDYDIYFQVIFGEYAQTYEGTDKKIFNY